MVLIIFHDFLRQRFFGPGFWNFVQAIILGFVLYYAATWAVRFALDKLAPGYTIYNNETVGRAGAGRPAGHVVCDDHSGPDP